MAFREFHTQYTYESHAPGRDPIVATVSVSLLKDGFAMATAEDATHTMAVTVSGYLRQSWYRSRNGGQSKSYAVEDVRTYNFWSAATSLDIERSAKDAVARLGNEAVRQLMGRR
jgi:hypothetical protein